MSYYKAVWDLSVWGWTLGISAFLAFVFYRILRVTLLATPQQFGVVGAIGVITLVLVLVPLAFAPRGYEIRGKTLRVRTILARLSYNLSTLSEARVADPSEVFSWRNTLRTFGVGGLFGYYGYFWNPRLGKFLAFATNRKHLVVLRFPAALGLPGRTLVVSPHDPHGFVQQVKQTIEQQ